MKRIGLENSSSLIRNGKRRLGREKRAAGVVSLAVILMILLPAAAFSQGQFLNKGESGFGVDAAYTSNKDASGFGGSMVYSIKGIIDIEASFSQVSLNQQPYKVSGFAVSPHITAYMKTHSSANRLFGSISMAYETDWYSSDGSGFYPMPVSGSNYSFGFSVSADLYSRAAVYCQPSLGVVYFFGKSETAGYFSRETIGTQGIVFSGGISVVFKTSRMNSFAIGPAVAVYKALTSFSISAAFVFGDYR
ncbi:MAG TPA: hypothetical protein VLX91_01530 [Candidatus Acidoferrales bacterium]|nr:hypothetical protein [Candidatus Acidoferrales bacterium]